MERSFVVKHASVLDAAGGFTDAQDIVVEDGVVSAMGPNLASSGKPVLDLDGLWLMPGLFDCHMHVAFSTVDQIEVLRTPVTQLVLEAARNARVTLEAGVTFVRDASGADAGIRAALDRGYVPGPRLQVSLSALSQTGGHGDGFLQGVGVSSSLAPGWPGKPAGVVDGVDGMRLRVRELLRAGVDWIKLCSTGGILSPHDLADQPQFVPEELQVAVLEGRRRGVPVMAHAFGGEGLSDAVAAGVRSIEHGLFLTEEQAAEMAADVLVVPTLAIRTMSSAGRDGVRPAAAVLHRQGAADQAGDRHAVRSPRRPACRSQSAPTSCPAGSTGATSRSSSACTTLA